MTSEGKKKSTIGNSARQAARSTTGRTRTAHRAESPVRPLAAPRGGVRGDSPAPGEVWERLALAAAAIDPAAALRRALTILASLYRADRAWLGRYNAALTHFWADSEYVHAAVASHFEQMQGVPVEVITDPHRTFLRGEMVHIPDIERLPRRSRGLQAELRRQGVRSTVACPLVHDDALIGFFGFDAVRAAADWTPADLDRLPAFGRLLAALLHRKLTADPPADLQATAPGAVYVTERTGRRALPLDGVLFIQADGDYSRVHMDDGRRYLELRSLRTWLAQLPRERFLRVHQSYLVNGARIARLDRGPRWMLYLHGTERPIPVGRTFRHALRLHMGF